MLEPSSATTQHRGGNGHVYSSAFTDETPATESLVAGLDGPMLAPPRTLAFTTGRRRKLWNKNVVALGLAGGFVEPLESTSIHLIQRGVVTLMSLFPAAGFVQAEIDCYNRLMQAEMEEVRDFVILHYKQSRRTDTPFWRSVQAMSVPDSLAERMAIFAHSGRLFLGPGELFREPSWVAVLLGQGLDPRGYDPLADALPELEVRSTLKRMADVIGRGVDALPRHCDVLPNTSTELGSANLGSTL